MDAHRFDAIARSVARLQTRRGLLRALGIAVGAGAVSAVATSSDGSTAATCRPGGALCARPGECCSGACAKDATGRGRCGCENGTTPCAANSCCQPGQRCVNGVCRQPTPTATATTTPTSTPTATATSTPLGECAAPDSDGTACDGGSGICGQGVCCHNGPLSGADYCNPATTGVCCAERETCCALAGCCRDCFRYSSQTSGSAIGGYVYQCCSEDDLCPPRTSPEEDPPFCCSGSASVCVHGRSDVPDGCYVPDQVCTDNSVCSVPCCGGTCCGPDETCAAGECRSANRACAADADCGSGEQCAGAKYQLVLVCTGTPGESDYTCTIEEQVVENGVCCGSRQVAGHPYAQDTNPYTKNTCCPSNQVVGTAPGGGSSTCCDYDYYQQCGACHTDCTPNGRISRF